MDETSSLTSLVSVATQVEKLGIVGVLVVLVGGMGWIIKKLFATIEDLKENKIFVDKLFAQHKEEVSRILLDEKRDRERFLDKIGETMERNTLALEELKSVQKTTIELLKEFSKERK